MTTRRCMALGSAAGHLTDNGNVTLCGIVVAPAGPDKIRAGARVGRRCSTCYQGHVNIAPDPPRAPLPALVAPRPPARDAMPARPPRPSPPPQPAVTVNISPDHPEHPLAAIWELCRRLDTAANMATRAHSTRGSS